MVNNCGCTIMGQMNCAVETVQNRYKLKVLEQNDNQVKFCLTENGVQVEPEISFESPPDKVIDNIVLGKVLETNVPYYGAAIGDFYLITTIKNSDKIIYTPLAELSQMAHAQEPLIAGDGIKISVETIDGKDYQKIEVDKDFFSGEILGYTAENVDNKVDIEAETLPDDAYPTAKSVKRLINETVGNISDLLETI